MYVIAHSYGVNGGCGDSIGTLQIIGIAQTEEEAKEYCDTWNNSHVYENPYECLNCGELIYEEVPLINDLSKPPHSYNESAAWAFDKDDKDYCDLGIED